MWNGTEKNPSLIINRNPLLLAATTGFYFAEGLRTLTCKHFKNN
jgi:hypothetical protein